ncbi:L-aspartate oxidase [Jatrophihabitans sp. YIM 134969]
MSGEREVDVLVVGAGVAGLSTALGLGLARSVLVVDAAPAGDGGSTRWAQGGIAAAVDSSDDPADHAADTAVAGAGLCDPRALAALVEEGPLRVAELIAAGARFDRADDGRLALGIEGGHHRRRVVHAGGDATGAEVFRSLTEAAAAAGIERLHEATVTGLLVADGRVAGADVVTPTGPVRVRARAVVLATGGLGHVYPASTNPAPVTGTGLALALRAGATLTDVEFVQFHPTALFTGETHGQLPLVTEALRGEGAILRDDDGHAFMAGRHPLADLAPRDVVARAIHDVMTTTGRPHVWLDATHLPATVWADHFPTVAAACAALGLDPRRAPIPVAPAEHFLCGGVEVDRTGRTEVAGLYAVGEVAATGVHGANRLASNSLLEGLVFGRRLAARLVLDVPDAVSGPVHAATLTPEPVAAAAAREILGAHAGVVRDAAGLELAAKELDAVAAPADPTWLVASAVVAAAQVRRESRGAHFRRDFPERSEWWRRRVAVRLDADGRPLATVAPSTTATVAA